VATLLSARMCSLNYAEIVKLRTFAAPVTFSVADRLQQPEFASGTAA